MNRARLPPWVDVHMEVKDILPCGLTIRLREIDTIAARAADNHNFFS